MKMDWEESPPPPPLFEKNLTTSSTSSSSTSHNNHQFLNNISQHRLITTATSGQNNYSSTSIYRIGQSHHEQSHNNQAINLSENNRNGFLSSSSANTSPSGSSTSSSPPLILSTSCESNGSSSINPTSSSVSTIFGSINSLAASTVASPSINSLAVESSSNSKTLTTNSTTSTSSTNTSSKKTKPIPPPLDLSIGAANLSLHSSEPDSSSPTPINLLNSANPIHGSCVTPHFFQPSYYLASPNLPEKSIPVKKRWHSWSPLLMNSQIDPMLPLFAETNGSGGNGLNSGTSTSNNRDQDQEPINTPNLTFSINPPTSSPSPWSSSSFSRLGVPTNSAHPSSSSSSSTRTNIKNSSNELQTPTPFYTPNEPSPKFMNSPVFSYSTPDTSLYQGPFSPIRSTNLFPPLLPSSPFFSSSNLNTPTFITNNNGAHNNHSTFNNHSSSSTTLTVPVPSFNGGNTSSTPSPHSSTSSSVSASTLSGLVPSTLLSPASSQASSSNSVSYEDLHEKSTSGSLNNSSKFNPIWNIFIPGTRIRFMNGLNSIEWHLVDVLDMKDDYAPSGLEVRTLVVTCSAKERIQMTLCPAADHSHPAVEVNCDPCHPFFVQKKGWCVVSPDIFFETHGIRCQKLECGDICTKYSPSNLTRKSPQLQHQNHHTQIQTDGLRNGYKISGGHSSTPPPPSFIDVKPNFDQLHMTIKTEPNSVSPLAHIPISVVRQKPQTTPNPPSNNKKKSGNSTSTKKPKGHANSQSEPRGRRPMNAFLLFAKDKRPELIQMYPGKDNRSISVLLGEAWQSLGPIEKEQYASNARAKAEEQKRMHPDCWKRKKAQSSTANASGSSNNLTSNSNKNPSYSTLSISNFQTQIGEM